MKIFLTILATALTVSLANAQKLKEVNVPAPVKEAFSKAFPTSKVKEWEKEGDVYEAEFELKKA